LIQYKKSFGAYFKGVYAAISDFFELSRLMLEVFLTHIRWFY